MAHFFFIWGFEQLPASFCSALTSSQVAAIDARNLLNWRGEQLGILGPVKIRALSYDQIKAITRNKQGFLIKVAGRKILKST
jgi:hypothetical protein